MKTKTTSGSIFQIFSISLVLLVAFSATLSAQENPRGEFYLKSQVKGFFSLKADYREFSDAFVEDINNLLLNGLGRYDTDETGQPSIDSVKYLDPALADYGSFSASNFGFHFEIGAQYHQLMTWMNIHVVPPTTSPAPGRVGGLGTTLWDVSYDFYGFDWMWAWMIAEEGSRFNLIPSLGAGLSVINVHFPSAYHLGYKDDSDLSLYTLKDKYYSSTGWVARAEMEFRVNLFNGLSLGALGGYRYSQMSRIVVETNETTNYYGPRAGMDASAWYAGAKLTWTLKSKEEKIREEQGRR
jgi:hypothetical protein